MKKLFTPIYFYLIFIFVYFLFRDSFLIPIPSSFSSFVFFISPALLLAEIIRRKIALRLSRWVSFLVFMVPGGLSAAVFTHGLCVLGHGCSLAHFVYLGAPSVFIFSVIFGVIGISVDVILEKLINKK